jgi:transcriptional regulator with XRE-family HTH domain
MLNAMRIRWLRFANSSRYWSGTRLERRLIELQITAAIAVRSKRRQRRLTQKQLASRLGTTQARISRLECAKAGISIDLYVRAMINLGATDDELAAALNPGGCRPVQQLRQRASLRFFPPPLDERGKRRMKKRTRHSARPRFQSN